MKTLSDYMSLALDEAKNALIMDEVPVGAVVVKDDSIIAKVHNLTELNHDSISHAEILAIRDAQNELGNSNLSGCTMFVTLEPCPMCAGAILASRLDMVVFGAFDERLGSCFSRVDLLNGFYDTSIKCIGGIMEKECGQILSDYFKTKR